MKKRLHVPLVWRRAWIIVMLLPLLGACSALRLSYGQGPLLAYWWLDNQVGFSDEQAPRVRAALDDWFAWHRASQLPDYVQALGEMAALAAGPLSSAQVCAITEAWQRRAERAFERSLPAAVEQLRALSPAQLAQLEQRQARKLKDAATELLQPEPAERRKAALARAVDRAETLYGSLTDGQRQLLAAGLEASPFDAERWLAERRARSADLLRSLRQWANPQAPPPDAASMQADLKRLGSEVLQSPRADYRALSRRLISHNCALAAQLHNSTSAEQRQRAVARLQGWQDDLRALADRR